MLQAELRGEMMARRAGDLVAVEERVADEAVAREGVRHPGHADRQVQFDPGLETVVTGARRVPVGRHGERRARERLHVDVQDLVVQLHVVRRHVPDDRTAAPTNPQLELPGVLSLEIDETRNGQAIELEQQRWLVRAAHVGIELALDSGKRVEGAHFGQQRVVLPPVGLVAVGEERIS